MPPCAELTKLFNDFSPTFSTAATSAATAVASLAFVVVAILGKRLQWVHFAAEQISNSNNNSSENVALLYVCVWECFYASVRCCSCNCSCCCCCHCEMGSLHVGPQNEPNCPTDRPSAQATFVICCCCCCSPCYCCCLDSLDGSLC